MTVNPASSEPLYVQIQQALIQEIRQGRYDSDGRLPSERELSERFNVSRMTARQALQSLLQKGWAYTQAGKGTYIRRLSFRQDLARLTSFSEDMRALGLEPRSKTVKAHRIHANDTVAACLRIDTGTTVIELQRVRLANRLPVAIETCYLIDTLVPGLLDKYDFSHESLYNILQHDYGFTLDRADQTIRAGIATRDEAELLAITDEKHPVVLQLSRVTYTPHDRPVEYVYSVYRAAFYEFHASLHGTHARIIIPAELETE
ncbi:MAG: GntR family transcriptional regulator [Anaerolineae bacterium]|nr:GntR family transcriptional regulator [Anaerolineae bacterium]